MKSTWIGALCGSALTLASVALGAYLFGAPPVSAQPRRGYTFCFFGAQEAVDIDNDGVVAPPTPARSFTVPAGYTVVSGGGGHAGVVLFCR
ncbi:MAG: hypothetical protein VYE22_01280 [Myxococcota bacterium]|nr:hypothetical protein [Myxococcota bacterium]